MTGSCPRARSLSTTCEPMNPEPPVTRTLIWLPLACRSVIKRNARVVAGHPVGVGQIDGVAHDPMAWFVVHTPRGALEPVEDDVLVEAGDHAVGQLEPARVLGIELAARHRVLEGHDLGH